MLMVKVAVGALLGALYFFAVSGWRKDGTPWFKARRAAGWWGLITAELMILAIGVPESYNVELSPIKKMLADIVFGSVAWVMLGVTTSLFFGTAAYILSRVLKK